MPVRTLALWWHLLCVDTCLVRTTVLWGQLPCEDTYPCQDISEILRGPIWKIDGISFRPQLSALNPISPCPWPWSFDTRGHFKGEDKVPQEELFLNEVISCPTEENNNIKGGLCSSLCAFVNVCVRGHLYCYICHITLCFTPLRPKFNPWTGQRQYVWKVSSVTCRRLVVSSGYSGFLHQITDFIIIISPPWYDPGCCWGVKPQ